MTKATADKEITQRGYKPTLTQVVAVLTIVTIVGTFFINLSRDRERESVATALRDRKIDSIAVALSLLTKTVEDLKKDRETNDVRMDKVELGEAVLQTRFDDLLYYKPKK